MRRTFLALLLLCASVGMAQAQMQFSQWPLAPLPLTGQDAVGLDIGSGCPNQPCATYKSPSTRVGQPVQQATAPLGPFPYQQWIDTSQSPPKLKEYIGATWYVVATLDPSAGFSFILPASSVIGLGTMATQNANAVAITGGAISGMANPTSSSQVATKGYVDGKASGIVFEQAVQWATRGILPNTPTYNNGSSGVGRTLTAGSNTTLTVDSNVVALNDRVLVKDQADQTQNGCYALTNAGGGVPWVLTGCTDFDQAAEMQTGAWFVVGNIVGLNAASAWALNTPQPVVVGSSALVFAQTGAAQIYTASTGLSLIGAAFSIANTGVTATSYGSPAQVGTFTVNAQGQLTSASNTSIAISASAITSGTTTLARGGTNADLSSSGGASQVLQQISPGANITVGRLACADLSNAVASCSTDATNASNIVSGTLAVARGGTGDAGTAWSTYALTVSCSGGGTPMVIGSATPRYKTLGKTVYLQVQFVVSTKSTCSNDVLNLPVTAVNDAANQSLLLSGATTVATTVPNTTNITLAPPLAGAGTYYISGVYESN